MRDGVYDPLRHMNYTKLVGRVEEIRFIKTKDSEHACISLYIETEFKNKKHPGFLIDIVAWDRNCRFLKNSNVRQNDTLHIYGRLTIRNRDGSHMLGVTANRIGIVRIIDGKESFVEKMEE